MTDRELMQMALDALGTASGFITQKWQEDAWKVQDLLSDRLAQPEPEPVAWIIDRAMAEQKLDWCKPKNSDTYVDATPLYTAPPKREWVGLTDEEIGHLMRQYPDNLSWNSVLEIEAKLKEKNT